MGTAAAIAAVCELTTTLLFSFYMKKFKLSTLIKISSIFFILKTLFSLLTKSGLCRNGGHYRQRYSNCHRLKNDTAKNKHRKQLKEKQMNSKIDLGFDVPDYKKIRVIIDTDAACEADDPFAIVQGLLSPKLIVKGIVAEHFNAPGSVEASYKEVEKIVSLMGLDTPIFMGQEGPSRGQDGPDRNTVSGNDNLSGNETLSEGVRFIIEEAMKTSDKPLYILCQGAITNVACALKACPEIKDKMTVIWIGTHGTDYSKAPFREFNAGNDIDAANFVLSSGIDLWLVPSYVYTTVLIGLAEIKRRIAPCGKIGKHLFENMVQYNYSENAGWTKGESWSLGDSPAIALAMNPDCGHFEYAPAPIVAEDTTSESSSRPMVRVYKDIDSRYILEDLIAKLELFAGL